MCGGEAAEMIHSYRGRGVQDSILEGAFRTGVPCTRAHICGDEISFSVLSQKNSVVLISKGREGKWGNLRPGGHVCPCEQMNLALAFLQEPNLEGFQLGWLDKC